MDKIKSIEDFWLCISENIKIKNIDKQKVHSQNYTINELQNLSKTKLISIGILPKDAEIFLEQIKTTNLKEVKQRLDSNEIKYTFIFSNEYPALLKEICSPPFAIYYKGDISILNNHLFIGVVGSRRPCDYGVRVTKDIVGDLTTHGLGIISGLALGIDAIAHKTSVDSKGITVAVLGCGLDQVYPISNTQLAKEILLNNGLIISEYPIGTPPLKQHFPARNRIVSGLSKGLLVTEAAQGSGSLITAQFALEQNRDVYAIPGSIYSLGSFGTNNLIKNGARMVTGAQDILDDLGIYNTSLALKPTIIASNPQEKLIITILELEPLHIDGIIKATKLDNSIVSSTLTLMEVTGKVRHLGGMVYRLNN